MADRHAVKYVDVRRSESRDALPIWRLTVWRLGGNINGSAQPFKILDCYECNERQVSLLIEQDYPDAKFAPVPIMIDDRLFVYDVSFKGL